MSEEIKTDAELDALALDVLEGRVDAETLEPVESTEATNDKAEPVAKEEPKEAVTEPEKAVQTPAPVAPAGPDYRDQVAQLTTLVERLTGDKAKGEQALEALGLTPDDVLKATQAAKSPEQQTKEELAQLKKELAEHRAALNEAQSAKIRADFERDFAKEIDESKYPNLVKVYGDTAAKQIADFMIDQFKLGKANHTGHSAAVELEKRFADIAKRYAPAKAAEPTPEAQTKVKAEKAPKAEPETLPTTVDELLEAAEKQKFANDDERDAYVYKLMVNINESADRDARQKRAAGRK